MDVKGYLLYTTCVLVRLKAHYYNKLILPLRVSILHLDPNHPPTPPIPATHKPDYVIFKRSLYLLIPFFLPDFIVRYPGTLSLKNCLFGLFD